MGHGEGGTFCHSAGCVQSVGNSSTGLHSLYGWHIFLSAFSAGINKLGKVLFLSKATVDATALKNAEESCLCVTFLPP